MSDGSSPISSTTRCATARAARSGSATLAVDGQAIVEIADRGPGIAAADLDRIFDPFYRVRADATAPPGTGLGLAIAADLARRNGGRLTVDSRPGDGAAFRLSLARAA